MANMPSTSIKSRLWKKARRKYPEDHERQREYVEGTLRKMGMDYLIYKPEVST